MEDLCAQHLSGFGTHSNHAGTEDRTHSVGACLRPQTDAFQTSSRGLLGCRSSSRLLRLPRMKAWANFKQPGLIWGWHCVLRRAPLGDGSMPILQSALPLASMADTVRPSSLRIHHPAWGSHRPRQRDSPCHSIHDLSTQYIYICIPENWSYKGILLFCCLFCFLAIVTVHKTIKFIQDPWGYVTKHLFGFFDGTESGILVTWVK